MTTRSPASSRGHLSGTFSKSSTPMTRPPRMCSATGVTPSRVTTRRLRTTRSGRYTAARGRTVGSESDQVQLDLHVAMLPRPDIERRAGNFVDEGHGDAEPREVDALQI